MSDSLSPVWGYSVHFAKFPVEKFSKGYCSHIFHPISTRLYGKHDNQIRCRILFMSDSFSLVCGHLVHFPMLRFQKAADPTVSIQFQPNFMQSMIIGRRGWGSGYNFLVICQI